MHIIDKCFSNAALSFDHKPNHPREFRRIYDNGGFVRYNGVWRVAGILACSRALGDYPLKEKNYVIATPDILTFDLNELKPKFAILASDGLFDFFSNEEAVQFVKERLQELLSQRFVMSKNELSLELAKELTLEAYKRGSMDNITVVIWIFDYDPVIKLAASFASVKEVKVRTKRADELELLHTKYRMAVNVNTEFTKESRQKVVKILESLPVTFKVSDLLEPAEAAETLAMNEKTEGNNEAEPVHADKKTEEETSKKCSKKQETSSKCDKKDEKKEEKKGKKFNLLNLELNLKSTPKPSSPDKKCDDKVLEIGQQRNAEDDKLPGSEEAVGGEAGEEAKQTEMDKNANYEVRLKDEYNLVSHHSPKKPKSPNKPRPEGAAGEDEFFDCK